MQDASRSMSWDFDPNRPRFLTASQPRPIRTRARLPPPGFTIEIRWPLDRFTDIVLISVLGGWWRRRQYRQPWVRSIDQGGDGGAAIRPCVRRVGFMSG